MKLKRADTSWNDDTALENITYNDKYVVVYDFSDTGLYILVRLPNQELIIKTRRPLSMNSRYCFVTFTQLG
jgi:hypothetical protein